MVTQRMTLRHNLISSKNGSVPGREVNSTPHRMTTQMHKLTPVLAIDLSMISRVDTSNPSEALIHMDDLSAIGVTHTTNNMSYVSLYDHEEGINSFKLPTNNAREFLRSAILRSVLREQNTTIPLIQGIRADWMSVLNPEDEMHDVSEESEDEMPALIPIATPPPLCAADALETVQGLGRARAEEWAAIKKNTRSVQHIYDDGDSSSDYDPDEEARRYRNAAVLHRENKKIERETQVPVNLKPKFDEASLCVEVMMNVSDENIANKLNLATIDFSKVYSFSWVCQSTRAFDIVFKNGACFFGTPSYFEYHPNGHQSDPYTAVGGKWTNPNDYLRVAKDVQELLHVA